LKTAEAVSDALLARCAPITVANGYETDMGLRHFRGARRVDETMLPCTVLIEGDEDPSRVGTRTSIKTRRKFALLAYVPCDAQNPNVAAHAAIRDMKRAIFTLNGAADWTLGGQVRDVVYLGSEIAARADGQKFVVAAVEVELEYVEDLALP
jgi:hypothetical protein